MKKMLTEGKLILQAIASAVVLIAIATTAAAAVALLVVAVVASNGVIIMVMTISALVVQVENIRTTDISNCIHYCALVT
jgi:hypothetical protein